MGEGGGGGEGRWAFDICINPNIRQLETFSGGPLCVTWSERIILRNYDDE